MIAGNLIDRNINFFQIDPKKDYVVIALAQGSVGVREVVRTMWSMIYWGWDMDRIAFLNGSVEYNYQNCKNYLVAKSSPVPKMTKEYHMSDLKCDRTSLHIYFDEMREIAKNQPKDIFLADARGTKEYSGAKKSATKTKSCGPNHDKQCYSAFRGHIRGAVDFPYTDILVMDDEKCDLNHDGKIDKKDASYKFKSYDDLKTLYACKGYKPGQTVVSYCRTGRKATLLALTSTMVLGYPFRMYDGSWMQWGVMANYKDTNGNYLLSEDSPLRTDTDTYSVIDGYNNPIDVEPRETYDVNESSKSAQNIKKEDEAYLNQ
jgi:3-mercaptopyruvate sulfurtransferase SseA